MRRFNRLSRPCFGKEIWVYTYSEEVDQVTHEELIELASVGYYESPLMNYFVSGKIEALPLYQAIVLHCILFVNGWVTAIKNEEGKIVATAWWLPPGKDLPIWEMLKKFPEIYKTFGLRNLMIAMYSFLAIMRTEIMFTIRHGKKPRIYLANIVVYKECRQQGLGKKLMQPILEWADKNDLLVYLEADGMTNIEHVYPSFGFQIFRWIRLLDKSIKYAAMIRFPKDS